MRFHSLVLSIVYNIPFLALSYWQKTEELLLDFDYKFKLNSRELEFEDFIKKFSDLTQANNSLFDFWAKIDKIRQDYKVNITKLLKNGLE
jgi:polysaccharide pyruvyl transferase WcaK-like protein